jgi:hypothetical protein
MDVPLASCIYADNSDTIGHTASTLPTTAASWERPRHDTSSTKR